MLRRHSVHRQKKKAPVTLASLSVTIPTSLRGCTRPRVERMPNPLHSPLSESPHCKVFNSFYMNNIKIKFPGCIWFSQ